MKGTRKWTVQQEAELYVPSLTIKSSLDARFLSGLKDEHVEAAKVFKEGELARIWKGGCIIRAIFLDRIKQAELANLLVCLRVWTLEYFDSKRRERLPANFVQAQRDYFGAHTYERTDVEGSFHTEWFKIARQSMN
uniref:phosphogluconate dehydrogenase (NADP(+)-dependent, decarboxylating) n=1 Tax=Brassica campestris TaxID=3711 RepID=M4E4M2_BRACM